MTLLSFRYAYRHVRAGFGRMVLSMIAIALGVALVVAFQLMNAAVLQSFLDTIDAMAGRAQLIVSAGEGLSFSEDVLDKVKAVDGVKLAVPLVRASAFPDDGSGEMLTVQGVDLTNESAIRVYHDADKPSGSPDGVIDDMVEFLNSPDSIILGREFAEKRGLNKGDKLPLITPNGVQTFTIKALLDAQGLAQTLRGRIVVMDLFAAQRAFADERQINQIDVLVSEPGSVAQVSSALERVIGPGLRVEEPSTRKGVVRGMLSGFQTMLSAFSLLSVLAGFVICFGRLSTIFESRTWEMGLMRSLGMRRTRALGELAKESLLLGVVGTIAGLALGRVIGHFALPFFAATTAIAFRMPIPSVELTTSVWAYSFGAIVGIGAAIAAAALPALRLANTEPITALRLRGRETRLPGSDGMRWLLQAALLASILAMLLLQRRSENPAYGLFTTVGLAALLATMAKPAVDLAPKILATLGAGLFGPVGRLGVSQIAQHSRRSALIVMTLTLGIGLVLLLGTLEWSFERTVVSTFSEHIRADLILSSPPSGGQWAPVSERVVQEVRAAEGVVAAAAEQIREMQDDSGSFRLAAFDEASFHDRRLFNWKVLAGPDDVLSHVSDGRGVLLTTAFARLRRLQVGDEINLPAPAGGAKLRVLGLSEAPLEPAVVMSRDLYRRLWNDRAVTFVFVALHDSSLVPVAEADIGRIVGKRYRIQTQRRVDYVGYFVGLVREGFAVQNLLAITVFVLVSVALSDAFASSVADRTRQLGMLRAVGLSRSEIFHLVLVESSTIAFLGIGLALLFGVVEGVFWVWVQFPALAGWTFGFHFPFVYAGITISIAVLLCLIGAAFPAYRAAHMVVAAALRTE